MSYLGDNSNVNVSSNPFGLSGGVVVSTAVTVDGNFFCIYPLTNCQVQLTFSNISDTSGNKSISLGLSAGVPVYGQFTSANFTSGTAILYNL